ncbi:MAG: hypothetical protein JRF61_11865 [Deltaproteobacteria bacterium]|jgi:hypothetical protein|nr:hypothetical protein [Deltaproteobacteria bacterium]
MQMGKILPLVVLAMILVACDPGGSAKGRPTPDAAGTDAAVRGFVMARWHEEIPHDEPGECPEGLNPTEEDYFAAEWASYMVERQRVREEEGRFLEWDHELLPPDACQDPLAQSDPGFITLDGPARVHGLDLDGVDSSRSERTAESCAHDDFTSPSGATGIDNQYWRLMGCIRGYRPNDLMDRLHRSNSMIKEGGYGILLEISGMDDMRDDEEVEVQILSAAEPVSTNAVGGIMENVSLTAHADSRYHSARARGRIVGGVLTTEPVDLRVKVKQQTQDNAVWYRDARIRAQVHEDGRIVGLIGAYWDLDNFWSMLNDHTIGERHQGRNAAFNRGFMCAGIYHAMYRVADGHPDADSGRCTSISTTIHFEAVPAFVIRPQLAMAE